MVGEESESSFPLLFLFPTTPLNILLANTSQVSSLFLEPSYLLHSLFPARHWPLICFVLYSDGLAPLVITVPFQLGV